MKRFFTQLIPLLPALFLAQALPAQSNEDLLNILKTETDAFANADFETWKSYWCQTENDYFSYTEQNNVFVVKGWPDMEQTFKAAFQGRKKYDMSFRRENVKMEREGKLVFITFDQYDKLNDAAGEVHKTETRVMKKTKNGWKSLSTEVVNMTSYE